MIAWFARNSVAANLLLFLIVAAGVMSATSRIPLEVFPSFSLDQIDISVPFRGATPEDAEKAVVLRIEEAIYDLQGIDEIRSRASESSAAVSVTLAAGANADKLLDDIRGRVDALSTLPSDAERPTYTIAERIRDVITVTVAADLPQKELREITGLVRDQLVLLPGITRAIVSGSPDPEIAVEIARETLSQYGLTLLEVQQAIRNSSLDLSAGQLKSSAGDILLRTKAQAYTAREFENIVIRANPSGTSLTLADIARVTDDLEEDPTVARFNGKRALFIDIYRQGDQSAIELAKTIRDYVDSKVGTWPGNVDVSYWSDRSRIVKARLATLTNSAIQGGILIFFLLSLFLRLQVAVWVCIGIPVSFCGALALMPELGATINIISLFAFILVLGIVVDDAIVTGESIYSRMQQGGDGLQAVIEGTKKVSVPVTFGVLTTAVAFVPLMFMEGNRGRIFAQLPLIVIPVMLFSLVESKLILPAHLKGMRPLDPNKSGRLTKLQRRFADGFEQFVITQYKPILALALKHRYLTVASFISILILTIGAINGGRIGFVFFPRVPSEFATVNLTMPAGTSVDVTSGHVLHIESVAKQLQEKYRDDNGESVVMHIMAISGGNTRGRSRGAQYGGVRMQLVSPEKRTITITTRKLVNEWRRLVGDIPGARSMSYVAEIGRGSSPLQIQVAGNDNEAMTDIAAAFRERLAEFPGVFGISDSLNDGKQQIDLTLRPEAKALGVTDAALAEQIRGAFFGLEAQRVQRGRDDLRVMVRLPAEQRSNLSDLSQLLVRTALGTEVPVSAIADLSFSRSSSSINRIDRQRIATIEADLDKQSVDAEAVKRELASLADSFASKYPHLTISLEGESREQEESFNSLRIGIISVLFIIYGLLAIPLKSYLQPLMVMSVIPFGIIGAAGGHLLMGFDLSLLSFMGMLALSGVVVNDSLVLVDYINQQKNDGMSTFNAANSAGAARFRAVTLTSLTTFVGLLPLMFEKSTQAQFLIPMGVSLAFGILFATLITLFLIPCNYLILDDAKRAFRKLLGSDNQEQPVQ